MVRKYSNYLFILAVLLVSVYYSYPEMLTRRPQSIHAWRQADDASFALNYYQDGMHFFQPEVNNLTTRGGTSGKTAPGENTYLYYFVAVLYQLFGYHEYIFRLVFTIIFLTGLYFLFRTTKYLFDDVFWAFALPLLLFSSPVLVYYGNNFLPNTPALALVLTGWFFFFRYRAEKKSFLLYLAMLFFLLASWLKITAMLSLAALGGIFILEWLLKVPFDGGQKLFPKPARFVVPAFLVIILVGAWVFFTTWYNDLNDSTYFVHRAFPFWTFPKEELGRVFYNIRHLWLKDYYHPVTLVFFSLVFVLLMIQARRTSRFLLLVNIFLVTGILFFMSMFLWFFKDHDYYSINLFILPVFLFLALLSLLKKHYHGIFASPYTKVLFSIFLIFNIWHAGKTVKERYTGDDNAYYHDSPGIYTITPWLREHGITAMDTVISVPGTSNVSLYLMNVKGWTQYIDTRFGKGEWVRYNQSKEGIETSIKRGAHYLVVNGIQALFQQPFLKEYAVHLTGTYGKVLVFNLEDTTRNFTMPKEILIRHLDCDAENVTGDGKYFINPADSTLFEFGMNRSSDFAHSGTYSILLDKDHPYGMTVTLGSLREDNRVVASVWRKPGGNDNSTIVLSGTGPVPFYDNGYKVVEEGTNGWEKIEKDIFIPAPLNQEAVKIYLYFNGNDVVYFDDFKVSIYGFPSK